jgi:hypothetical protein
VNCGVDVCACHCAALSPYSFRQAPSCHLYDVDVSLCYFSSVDVVFLGWPALSAAGGPVDADALDFTSVAGSPFGGGTLACGVIGMVVDSKS